MKDIAVISLTRFGDLIQATPLLRILKRTYPGARITLVAEQRFTTIIPLIRGYDRIITLRKDEVADRIVFASDPLVPYFFMEGFVRELEEVRYDLAINITFSRMSAFLTSLVNAGKLAGTGLRSKGGETHPLTLGDLPLHNPGRKQPSAQQDQPRRYLYPAGGCKT